MHECPAVLGEEGAPQQRPTPSKMKRRFSLRRNKASVSKENTATGATVSPWLGGAAFPWHQGVETPPRRKESSSSGMRRKSLRLMTLPFRQASGHRTKGDPSPPHKPLEAPSVFERECLNNLSPNDPEFVRRTSMRWQRKTGVAFLPQGSVCRVPPTHGCLLEVPSHCTKFEWPTHPSQQPAFYKRVSVPQRPHDVPLVLVSPVVPPNRLRYYGQSPQHRDLLMRSQRRHSASGISQRSLDLKSKSSDREPAGRLHKRSLQPSRRRLSLAGDKKGAAPSGRDARRSSVRCADDSVTEAFRKLLRGDGRHRSTHRDGKKRSRNPDDENSLNDNHFFTTTTPLRRLSHRLRKSFGGHKRDCDQWSQSDLSSGSDLSSTSSRSCHSFLSSTLSSSSSCRSDLSFRSDLSSSSFSSSPSSSSSVFSSSSSCHSDMSMLSSSSLRSSSSSSSRLGFHEIFVAEPEIAETFAIMFPSEPRPEWHRHLRQVLHKAGQKIFKKPEQHDTHIPENLRYQLKQIYVY
ncbi:uncharacterized protein LOC122255622 [Penaeus japonicus]|uniref:uncharacterized protein LOC122255622 n=1 Tax=Penaeus japonicus TaxID=27405 RepID=UPI001C70BE64|nr:uncharacterized protein LOC122255622 [Penaeus japonicus]